MSLKRQREDEDGSAHTSTSNQLPHLPYSLTSTPAIPDTASSVKRARHTLDQAASTQPQNILFSFFSGTWDYMRNSILRRDAPPPSHSQMRATKAIANGNAKLPVGVRSLNGAQGGVLAQLLKKQDEQWAEREQEREGREIVEGQEKSQATKIPAVKREPVSREMIQRRDVKAVYPTPDSSQESVIGHNTAPARMSPGKPSTISHRVRTQSPLVGPEDILFPTSNSLNAVDRAAVKTEQEDDDEDDEEEEDLLDGTASQPVEISDDEDDTPRKTIRIESRIVGQTDTPVRPAPRRPELKTHTAPVREYEWLETSSSHSGRSSHRRTKYTAKRKSSSSPRHNLRSPQGHHQEQLAHLKRQIHQATRTGDHRGIRALKDVANSIYGADSPSRRKELLYMDAMKRRTGKEGLEVYRGMLTGTQSPTTLPSLLQKPKPEPFSVEKQYKKADLAKSRIAQTPHPSAVADIVDHFSKTHLEDEEKIRKALEKSTPSAPTAMSAKRANQVAAHFKNPAFDFRIKDKSVTNRDIAFLRPREWLNDEVINTYLTMIRDRSEQGSGAGMKDVYDMSTFFYQKLSTQGYEAAKLARWTKRAKVDIFAKDLILIPVNVKGMHWCAAAINNVERRFEYYDSMGDASGHRREVFKNLRAYMHAEHLNKKSAPWNDEGWTEMFMENNGSDCGVFTCQTLEALARGRDLSKPDEWDFGHKNMPYIRQLMVYEFGAGRLEERWPDEK